MATLSGIAWHVWFAIHHTNCVYKIMGHNNTYAPKVLEMLSITFSSDLRKPYCWHGKSLSPANKNSVLENVWNLVQLLHLMSCFVSYVCTPLAPICTLW